MEAEVCVRGASGVVLKISPVSGPSYIPPRVQLKGCAPGAAVEFTLSQAPENPSTDVEFISRMRCVAGSAGEVDLASSEALEGSSYSGPDAGGLWWSAAAAPGARRGVKLSKRQIATPRKNVLSVEVDGVAGRLGVELSRAYLAEGVQRQVLDGQGGSPIDSVLLMPPPPEGAASPARRSVVLVGGSAGELMEVWGGVLASLGHPVLCLRWFGKHASLPTSANGLDLEYVIAACAWLSARAGPPLYDPEPVLMGLSLGAQIVVDAAAAGAKVSRVVALSGSHVRTRLPDSEAGRALRGKTLASVPFDAENVQYHNGAVELTNGTFRWLGEDEDARAAAMPCAHVPCPVLLVSGSGDKNWASEEMSRKVMEQLTRPCHAGSLHLAYKDAGHMFDPPLTPLTKEIFHPPTGVIMAFGGDAAAHEQAQADMFPRLLAFLGGDGPWREARL